MTTTHANETCCQDMSGIKREQDGLGAVAKRVDGVSTWVLPALQLQISRKCLFLQNKSQTMAGTRHHPK